MYVCVGLRMSLYVSVCLCPMYVSVCLRMSASPYVSLCLCPMCILYVSVYLCMSVSVSPSLSVWMGGWTLMPTV